LKKATEFRLQLLDRAAGGRRRRRVRFVDTLHAEVTKSLAIAETQTKLAAQGVEPNPMTPTEMDAMNKREIDLNLKIAKEAG